VGPHALAASSHHRPSAERTGRRCDHRLRRVVIGDVAAIAGFAELEREVIGRRAANDELSEMDCFVVAIAYGSEVPELVAAAAALILDMVQVQPDIPAASRHGAAVSIASEDLFAFPGGDRGGDPLRRRRVQRAQVDGITRRALGNCWIDLDVPAAAELPGALAVRALLDGDLVSG
jgi:hypothetical protein